MLYYPCENTEKLYFNANKDQFLDSGLWRHHKSYLFKSICSKLPLKDGLEELQYFIEELLYTKFNFIRHNEQIRVITVPHEDKFILMYSETTLKNNSVQDLKPVFSSFFLFEIVQ